MPGICGIVERESSSGQLNETLCTMQEGLAHEDWYVRESRCDAKAGVGLGSVRLGYDTQPAKLAWDPQTGNGIVLDGELYGTDALLAQMRGESGSLATNTDAAILLAVFLRCGPSILRKIDGSFSAAIWNAEEGTLTLLTDRFGTRPLYYATGDGGKGFRFASGVASLLAGSSDTQQIDPKGLAQFFTFGHYLRDNTSLEGVQVLPAAACFTYVPRNETLRPGAWWSPAESSPDQPQSEQEWLERIDAAFTAAVRRRTEATPHLGISLSGGLDARTILGLVDTQETPLRSVCLGVQGSLDHRAAAQLARIAGSPFEAHVLDAGFLGQFRQHLERMVQLTDGQYMSQCIVIPTLAVYRRLGIRTLLRGHAGELLHMRKAYNYSVDDAALEISTSSQLRAWLFRRLQAYMLDGVTTPLFAAPYQAGLQELAAESLDEDLSEVAHIESPLARIWHLFVRQRLRRETVLSMLKFRSVVEPRLPYLDADLMPLLLAAPTGMKLGERIQTHILSKHRPAFLNVTNANTGARMGAGPLVQRMATLQKKVLAKLGVPGYQPYERLGLWLRRELAPTVREILLDPRTLDRGVFRPEGIQTVVRQHLEQGQNRTYLLMALMIFELGLRRLTDGESGGRQRQPSAQLVASR